MFKANIKAIINVHEGCSIVSLLLKLVSTIFFFLLHRKRSFRSRDIQIFVIFSLPLHTFQTEKDKWKWNNL